MRSMVSRLNDRRPLEPIYSVKRLMVKRERKKSERDAQAADYLDLARPRNESEEETTTPPPINRFKEVCLEALQVSRFLQKARLGSLLQAASPSLLSPT